MISLLSAHCTCLFFSHCMRWSWWVSQKNAKSKTTQLGPDHILVPTLTSPPMPQNMLISQLHSIILMLASTDTSPDAPIMLKKTPHTQQIAHDAWWESVTCLHPPIKDCWEPPFLAPQPRTLHLPLFSCFGCSVSCRSTHSSLWDCWLLTSYTWINRYIIYYVLHSFPCCCAWPHLCVHHHAWAAHTSGSLCECCWPAQYLSSHPWSNQSWSSQHLSLRQCSATLYSHWHRWPCSHQAPGEWDQCSC